jgi:hypothetical protein
MHGFHLLVYIVGGVRGIDDTQCGYKLFTRNAGASTRSPPLPTALPLPDSCVFSGGDLCEHSNPAVGI